MKQLAFEGSPALGFSNGWNILDHWSGVVYSCCLYNVCCCATTQANVCQCQRLGARLAALKKPMVAVHRGRQTADHSVLATIKDLVTEAQHFMERYDVDI